MCVLSINVPIRKKSGNFLNNSCIFIYIIARSSQIIAITWFSRRWNKRNISISKDQSGKHLYNTNTTLWVIMVILHWQTLPSQLGLWNTLTAPLQRSNPAPNECPGYDTKQSDGEVPSLLEIWGMRSTPSLPSLPGPLWPGVVAPDRALSMG